MIKFTQGFSSWIKGKVTENQRSKGKSCSDKREFQTHAALGKVGMGILVMSRCDVCKIMNLSE